jgi:hypothetical protein
MTDKELLELAAKAAGIERRYYEYLGEWGLIDDGPDSGWWNPLTDDGDALRLAVKLGLKHVWFTVEMQGSFVQTIFLQPHEETLYESHAEHPDAYAATRRAIVRAAAEIERNKA